MTALSVNLNKIALLRNARGEGAPDLTYFAELALSQDIVGVTVHPRPDGRHITYDDVKVLKKVVGRFNKELNVEGYPSEAFLNLVQDIKPHQVTLVPDPPDALTSSFGYDLTANKEVLTDTVQTLQSRGIRTSIFIDPGIQDARILPDIGTDRVELYTYDYAKLFKDKSEKAINGYQVLAEEIHRLGIGLNAGHDLNLKNLPYFLDNVPNIQEVSIGHALICESLEEGFVKTIQAYTGLLKQG